MYVFKHLGMAALASCLFAVPVTGFAASSGVVKLGLGQPEGSLGHITCVKFKEIIEKESNGRFTVNIFPGEQMGSDLEMVEATQMGNLTAASVAASGVGAFNKDYFVLDMPFMFKDRAEAYEVLDGKFGQALLQSLEKLNIKAPVFYENGFRHVTNSKRPVHKPEDVKSLKLRTMQNAIHLALWKELGANPTPMGFGEVFVALQQKTIDGQENPPMQVWDNKLYEVQPYMSLTYHIYSPMVLVLNKDFFDALSDDDKKLFQSASEQMRDYNRIEAQKLASETIEKLKGTGMITINTLTDEEHNLFREKAKAVRPMIEERLSPEILAMFKEHMDK